MSSTVRPCFSSGFGIAYTGPMPIAISLADQRPGGSNDEGLDHVSPCSSAEPVVEKASMIVYRGQ
jgi:hypothetical protein